jgi:hypothetical protein
VTRLEFRVSDEKAKRFRHACVDRQLTLQDAMAEALDLWMADNAPIIKPRPKRPASAP